MYSKNKIGEFRGGGNVIFRDFCYYEYRTDQFMSRSFMIEIPTMGINNIIRFAVKYWAHIY